MSATGIPTPMPILADVGKLFSRGAALDIGTGAGVDGGVVVGVLVGVEFAVAEDGELAVDAELSEVEGKSDEEDLVVDSALSSR